METHKEWIGGLKSRVRPLESLVNPLNGGSGSAKPGCGAKSWDQEAKVARGRIELPTRGPRGSGQAMTAWFLVRGVDIPEWEAYGSR